MAEIKIIDLLPEDWRDRIISEVEEIIKEKEKKKQDVKAKQKPSEKEVEDIVNNITY